MRLHSISRKISALAALGGVLLLALALMSCDGTGTGSTGQAEYRLQAAAVQDLNTGRTVIIAELYRNDTLLPTATLTFDTLAMTFGDPTTIVDTLIATDSVGDTTRFITTIGPVSDSAYAVWLQSSTLYAGDAVVMNLSDGSRLDYDAVTTIVDTFSILPDGIVPQSRVVRAGDVVVVDWSGSANATTYVVAAVRADTGYTGDGHALYPIGQTTDGTLPVEAFQIDGTDDLDTGLYRIYAYSIYGSPDSALASEILPTPLPSQLADNLDSRLVRGRLGTVMVTLLDTVRVSAQ